MCNNEKKKDKKIQYKDYHDPIGGANPIPGEKKFVCPKKDCQEIAYWQKLGDEMICKIHGVAMKEFNA